VRFSGTGSRLKPRSQEAVHRHCGTTFRISQIFRSPGSCHPASVGRASFSFSFLSSFFSRNARRHWVELHSQPGQATGHFFINDEFAPNASMEFANMAKSE
jgi:hypothetical protein